GVHPPHLLGSELAVRMARRLVQQAKEDKDVRKLLRRVTFYIIPRPAPDACEALFHPPHAQRTGNERPTDDDRDGQCDEDGPEDLNGDGLITMMRVEDHSGPYIPHPDDERVMIRARADQGEHGRFLLYREGRDNDEDEQFNEDPPGGVAFNRNFTFRYPYFEEGAGPHQVSEIESRAVADYAFSHANIAAVLTFTPDDNLMRPWKPDPESKSERIKTSVLSDDAEVMDYLAEQYRTIHGGKDPPEASPGEGSFSEWAYFHFGRWSLACRGWWIPKVEPDKKQVKPADKGSAQQSADGKQPPEEKVEEKAAKKDRAADELNALRWFAQEGIDGFVAWEQIEHSDFPGKRVEVGGFRPLVRCNPPADRLDRLEDVHWKFLRRLAGWLPRLKIRQTKVEPLGGGVWRVTVEVANDGYLPTVAEMGRITERLQPLQAELELPEGVTLVAGYARIQFPPLAGGGGTAKRSWVVLAPEGESTLLRVRVWSPSVGKAARRIRLKVPEKPQQEE
ncbi:MAG: hypothetical protein A2V70_15085, partial [Planctomycetes bacterium RBG_13_63_9]